MIAFVPPVNPLEQDAIYARSIESFLPIRAIVMTTLLIVHAQEGTDLVA
jgi:hypothetical protein